MKKEAVVKKDKLTQIRFPTELKRELKAHCALREIYMDDFVIEAVTEKLDKLLKKEARK